MALKIVWTKRAIAGYAGIITYLEEEWTEKEVRNFVRQTEEFFKLLSEYPEILQKTKDIKMCAEAQLINRLSSPIESSLKRS